MTRKDYEVVAEVIVEVEKGMRSTDVGWPTSAAIAFLNDRFANFDEDKFVKYIKARCSVLDDL